MVEDIQLRSELRESPLDNAESALDDAVDKGEGWAVCFLLKCLGRDRGYVESRLCYSDNG